MYFNHLYYLLFSFSNLNIMTLLQKAFRQGKKFLRNFFIFLFLAVAFTVSAQSETKFVGTDSSKIEDAKTSPTKAIAANVDSVQTKTAKAKIAKVAVIDSTKANIAEKNTVKAKPITDGMKAEMALAADSVKKTSIRMKSVGLNLGLVNGIGIDFAYRFAKHWTGRFAYNYADYTKTNYTRNITSTNTDGTKSVQNLSFDASVKLSNIAINIEFTPGSKGRFKLLGGLSYLPNNKITASGKLTTTVKFNDVVLNPEDLGDGSITIGFKQAISPFVGMGFGRTFPRKRMNVSLDLGTYYKGDYKVDILVNQGVLLKQNEENAAIIERNLNAKWNQKLFPVLNLRLAYLLR